MNLRNGLLLAAFQILFGVVVFAATRAYYLDQQSNATPARSTAVAPGAVRPLSTVPAVLSETLADDPQTLAGQADRMFKEKRFVEAIDAYRKLLVLDPGQAATFNDLGLSLHYVGRTNEALDTLVQGIAAEPQFQRIWLTLGYIRAQIGQYPEAREALERAVAIAAEDPIGIEAARMLEKLPK